MISSTLLLIAAILFIGVMLCQLEAFIWEAPKKVQFTTAIITVIVAVIIAIFGAFTVHVGK